MTDYVAARKQFVSWVKQTLTGEKLIDDMLIAPNPLNLYTTGILYPAGIEMADEPKDNLDYQEEKDISRYQPPSSMGFSFYIDSKLSSIRVFFSAVKFEIGSPKRSGRKTCWKKNSLVQDEGEELVIDLQYSSQHLIMENRARIDVKIRSKGVGRIVTVTLLNIQPRPKTSQSEWTDFAQHSLFESTLKCFLPRQAVQNYPRVNPNLLNDEERELEIRYKDEHIFAIGHGVAADWRFEGEDIVIFSDFMPSVEVAQVTANVSKENPETLSFRFLSKIQNNTSVFFELNHFIASYQDWIEGQEQRADKEDAQDKETAQRLIERMKAASRRMQIGLSLLKEDENAQIAFAMTNKAMQMQMELGGTTKPEQPYGWRPFQLAFILMALESSINENSEDRDLVDLIWFPTGGGKTEAYLGLMAFMFVYRRLRFQSSGGGTTAVMRYTLRLLTSQQFIRACKVISALELLRRKNNALGAAPFTVGLWLGGESSPNTFANALKEKENHNFSKFVLQSCPWCSASFNKENYLATDSSFHFTCKNSHCDFGKDDSNPLPYNVVDEALYDEPPSLLIATVDKFARLPWEPRAASFFGGNLHRPPELIIQDELHLISGALGSIVGLYEVGFETILTSRGVYPKFVASTATVRQAQEQVRSLFAREMAVFPPVGLRQKDSYFAKEVPLSEKPGRLYVGYMAFARSKQNSMVDLSGVIAAAPKVLFHEDIFLKDAWWTQLVYHGSLKSVGNSRTNFQSGIPQIQARIALSEFYKQLNDISPGFFEKLQSDENVNDEGLQSGKIPEYFMDNNELIALCQQFFPIRDLNVKSLTSNQTANENANVFEALSNKFDHENSVDCALATNMVSVGLDVPRLATMVINGQPLTTAEYIQTSSRVGRGAVPGVVFTNYYKTQARSLSHYENFRSYHRSFYRYVEPSSLTPFTEQVRKRALHAALVMAIRHGEGGLLDNEEAEDFDLHSPQIKKILRKMKTRIKTALKASGNDKKYKEKMLEDTLNMLDKLVQKWVDEIKASTNLRYRAKDKAANSLLVSFENTHEETGLWETLNSMRNVEKTALLELREGGE